MFRIYFQISHLKTITSNPLLCKINGILLHFFWLTAFLIMSFISLKFFYRFSNICKPWFMKHDSGKDKVMYCWLIGILMMSIPVVMDNFSEFALDYAASRGICFIEPKFYINAFFVSPTLFLITINTVCFIATIIELHKARPDENDVTTISDTKLAKVFAKIGGLMGVTWLFALVPFLTKIEELWFVFILLNGFQGVCIFIVSGISTLFLKKFKPVRMNTRLSRHTTSSTM